MTNSNNSPLFNLMAFLESILIYSTIGVIYASSPVISICYLISCFLASSILILFMGAQLLAIIFLMIYVGAISVLFVFVIMMLNIKKMEINIPLNRWITNIVSALTGFILYSKILEKFENFFLKKKLLYFKIQEMSYNSYLPTTYSKAILNKISNNLSLKKSIQYYSDILYIDHFLMFWIGGMVLLLAMVGAIIISLNKSITIYRQNTFSQINKNEKNSLFLFKKSIKRNMWKNFILMNIKKIKNEKE